MNIMNSSLVNSSISGKQLKTVIGEVGTFICIIETASSLHCTRHCFNTLKMLYMQFGATSQIHRNATGHVTGYGGLL